MDEREELMRLLTALISAQDDVSRMSDRGGPESDRERLERIIVRNEYRNRILAFFDELRAADGVVTHMTPDEWAAYCASTD